MKDEPLLSPQKSGSDGANTFPSASKTAVEDGMLAPQQVHSASPPQQSIASDCFRVKRYMPRIGGVLSFHSARRTIAGVDALLWPRQGSSLTRDWTPTRNQNSSQLSGMESDAAIRRFKVPSISRAGDGLGIDDR